MADKPPAAKDAQVPVDPPTSATPSAGHRRRFGEHGSAGKAEGGSRPDADFLKALEAEGEAEAVREAIATFIREWGLTTRTREPGRHLGIPATQFMSSVGHATEVAVTQLIELLDSEDREVQDAAATILGIMGSAALRAGPALFQKYRSDNSAAAEFALMQIHGLAHCEYSPSKFSYTINSDFNIDYDYGDNYFSSKENRARNYWEFLEQVIEELSSHYHERASVPKADQESKEAKPNAATSAEAYEKLAHQLEGRIHEVKREVAAEIAPSLNTRIQAMPHGTYEQKKEVARWANEELRRFDLAIKGPTGQPSTLVALPGNPPEVESGRWQLEHKSPEGKRVRTQLPPQLPSFELMEAQPRREGLREWREKVTRQPRGASRA